jgi:hypothetical protein
VNAVQESTWEVLPRAECVVGLQSQRIGRIAISVDALPVVLPVYFVYDGAAIVFRTHAGSVLDRNCRNTVVAFEADSHDPGRRTGWSVLAVGVANVVGHGVTPRDSTVQLDRMGAPAGEVVIRIEPGSISGRALRPQPTTLVVDAR